MENNNSDMSKKIMVDFVNGRLTVVESPKDKFNFVKYLKPKEIEKLVEAVSKEKSVNGIRDMTILLLILQGGFRKASILNAKWQDIVIADKSILVNYWNRDKSYYVKLSDQLILYLNEIRKNALSPSTYIFSGNMGRPISKNQINKILGHLSTYTSYSKAEFYRCFEKYIHY